MNEKYKWPHRGAFRYCPKCGKPCGCSAFHCIPQCPPMRRCGHGALAPLASRPPLPATSPPASEGKNAIAARTMDLPVIATPGEGRALDIRRPKIKNDDALITYLERAESPRMLNDPLMKCNEAKTPVVELPQNDPPMKAGDVQEDVAEILPAELFYNEAAVETEDSQIESGEQVDLPCNAPEDHHSEPNDPDSCGAVKRRGYFKVSRIRRPGKSRPEKEGLYGRGLYRYRKWWKLSEVDIRVCGDLLTGTPIFTDSNTLRVVNDVYSYFIPLEKVDYIRTRDGLRAHPELEGAFSRTRSHRPA